VRPTRILKGLVVAAIKSLIHLAVLVGRDRCQCRPDLVRLGSEYGGWWIPRSAYSPTERPRIAISAGKGMDVTFDVEVLKAGFNPLALGPLEECVTYAIETLCRNQRFRGLWKSSGEVRFFAPKDLEHDSWSATNIHESEEQSSVVLSVISFEDLPLYLSSATMNFRYSKWISKAQKSR